MISITIHKAEAGRKLFRFLEKLMPLAPRGMFFKALRNKKIKVNGKKPEDLNLILQYGDELRLFFTDEQLSSFGYEKNCTKYPLKAEFPSVPVIYEDDNLLILDKPAGLLSQKSKADDISLNEIGCHMIEEKSGGHLGYRPGVCNRLDRNTAGAVIMAKNLEAGQAISIMLREHRLGKFYWALVKGKPIEWMKETTLIHGWKKDETNNKAVLADWHENMQGYHRIECRVRLLQMFDEYSLVEICLLTGKSHQIRSQLAREGYPILQDGKYNAAAKEYKPMLVAKRLEFNRCPEVLRYMDGKIVEAATPLAMQQYLTQ